MTGYYRKLQFPKCVEIKIQYVRLNFLVLENAPLNIIMGPFGGIVHPPLFAALVTATFAWYTNKFENNDFGRDQQEILKNRKYSMSTFSSKMVKI